jgi:hypothetical protein
MNLLRASVGSTDASVSLLARVGVAWPKRANHSQVASICEDRPAPDALIVDKTRRELAGLGQ